MAKNNGTWIKVLISLIVAGVGFGVTAAGVVYGYGKLSARSEVAAKILVRHIDEDKTRDDEAHVDIEELEKGAIEFKGALKSIKEGQQRQQAVSKERYMEQRAWQKEMSAEIRALPKEPQ